MAMLILFSNFYGYWFREWQGASNIPKKILHAGMAVIVVSTLIIAYGNYLGKQKKPPRIEQEVNHETVWLGR
jgi:L-rhamnose-H+ transport protein